MKNNDLKKTWCKHEFEVGNPKNIEITVDDLNRDSPPMIALCFSFKQVRS